MKMCVAQTSIPFFSRGGRVSAIYKSIIIILLVNLPLVFIYKFRKKETQLQPRTIGEPREHRLGEVLQGRSKLKFKSYYLYSLNLPLAFIFKCHFDKFQNQQGSSQKSNDHTF